ncbi:MAG: zinc-dependent metalloprotease [Thermomicrobiales bacterium]
MPSRSKIDPRILVAGLLTGAVVGVWAGRRAQDHIPQATGAPGSINWDRARSVAISMNRESLLTEHERRRLDSEYHDLVQQTIPLVADFTGASLPFPLDKIYTFDRVDWIEANLRSFQHMFEPIERLNLLGGSDSSRPANAVWNGLNQTVVSSELGLLLGYLARRVLGQYDLALLGREPLTESGKLYFVQPNIRNLETSLHVPPQQFRLWLALHETTHAFEFEGHPWVREHMNDMIDEYFDFLTQDVEYLKRGVAGMRAIWQRSHNSDDKATGSWIEMVMTPDQRRLFARMQATMAVIEGYSNYVMNAVGRKLMPDYALIARRFELRQIQRSPAEQLRQADRPRYEAGAISARRTVHRRDRPHRRPSHG